MGRPCHILAPEGKGTMAPWGGAYAKPRSLCGKKNPLPVIRPEFIQAHVAGHGLELCPACVVADPSVPLSTKADHPGGQSRGRRGTDG